MSVALLALAVNPVGVRSQQPASQPAAQPAPQQRTQQRTPEQLEIERLSIADRQKMMDLLGIKSLRLGPTSRPEPQPGRSGVVNYDESKANPYPDLPDPLVMKNGQKVTSADMWWKLRRPEIVEDFDREIYGRAPKTTPAVKWEVLSTTRGMNGDVPIVTKELVGHVDNSSYPRIAVAIELTLTTPANATGPAPVIMEFGGRRRGAPPVSTGRTGPPRPPCACRTYLATAGAGEGLGLRPIGARQHSG